MNWDIVLTKTLAAFALPPGLFISLFLLAFLLGRKFRVIGVALFTLAFLSLYALSTPFVAIALMSPIQPAAALRLNALPIDEQNTAIVVLGGGRKASAPEYDNIDIINAETAERLRYAARLQKQMHLPVLLSGGKTFGEPTAEAVLMNEAFISDFRGAPNWLETQSRNTAENAQYSARILAQQNIQTIYLVTHAWHMPRALQAFEGKGLKVIAAPMGYEFAPSGQQGLLRYVPKAEALLMSSRALHERLGLLWASMF